MLRTVLIYTIIIALAIIFIPIARENQEKQELSELSKEYVENSITELETQNVVTSVVVTYRGLDTLGEVTVLFLATSGVGFLINKRKKGKRNKAKRASEILSTGSFFIFPIIILFGVYVFIHGHLTPGGGFQGGVLIASAFVLMMLVETNSNLNHLVLESIEAISGFSYVIIATLGLVLLGSFLDPTFLPMGKYGMPFSAGAIPLIYSFVGLKVGAELTNIVDSLRNESTKSEEVTK